MPNPYQLPFVFIYTDKRGSLVEYFICVPPISFVSSPRQSLHRRFSVRFGCLSLRPALLGRLAQRPERLIVRPAGLTLDGADAGVFGAAGKEVDPVGQLIIDLLRGRGALARLEGLEGLGRVQRVDLRIVAGEVHLLDAAQVRRAVVGEAARHEAARRVHAGKHVVRAARSVRAPVGRHVVYGAVDREVDGLLRVAAVVGG